MNRIINLFNYLAKPHKNKECSQKLESIESFFKERSIQIEYIPGQGLIVNKQENPRLVCISHIDLIPLFNLEFSRKTNKEDTEHNQLISSMYLKESNISVTGLFKISNGILTGALDNTITNAISLLVCEELISNGINDIEFFFSEMEEIGFIGMKNYLLNNPIKSKNTFFVNLDVTNEGYGNNYISIEFDKPIEHVLSHLKMNLNLNHTHYTVDRVFDDIDAVIAAECNGLSYCLPTKGNIHSFDNSTKLESLVPYKEGLYKVLSTLKLN